MRLIIITILLSFTISFSSPTFNRPDLVALPLNEQIIIDGRLDEEFWNSIEPATGFIQNEPFSGELATQKTEVRIGYNDTYVFIGARMFDSEPDKIAAQLFRRDGMGYSDWFEVII